MPGPCGKPPWPSLRCRLQTGSTLPAPFPHTVCGCARRQAEGGKCQEQGAGSKAGSLGARTNGEVTGACLASSWARTAVVCPQITRARGTLTRVRRNLTWVGGHVAWARGVGRQSGKREGLESRKRQGAGSGVVAVDFGRSSQPRSAHLGLFYRHRP
jgi:hypothetical protein